VTPDQALVDPAEAQEAMIDRTVDLAMQAITVGMEVGSALEALEAGRTKDLEKLAGKEPKPADPEPKPGEPPKTTDPAPAPGQPGSAAPGTVDPRLTTKTGLASADAIRKHTEAMHQIGEQWAKASPVERAFLLQGRAQAAAADAGVPGKIIITPDRALSRYHATWHGDSFAIHVSHDVLNDATADMGALGELVYHEARHAEQSWQMARMRAAMGDDAPTIAKRFGMPQNVAEQAVAQQLAPGSEEYRAAFRWYDSIYGAGSLRRTELLKSGGLLDTAEAKAERLEAAYKALQKNPAAKVDELTSAKQEWKTAWDEWAALDKEYRMLPEEQDAYLVAGRAKAQMDLTNPDTAPVTQPNPSVPPPDTTPSPPPAQQGS
jgi:hypothetical protein